MTLLAENWDDEIPRRPCAVIYVLIDPRNRQARYVGKTLSGRVRIRLTAHIRDKIASLKRNWIHSLKSLCLEPEIEVVETLDEKASHEDWKSAEMFWISYLRFLGADLTNLTDGGEGLHGHKFTPDHRRKIGQAHIGRIVSAETAEKLRQKAKAENHDHLRRFSASQIGKKLSPEHCAKLSIVHRGRKHTPETKAKMSASALGKPKSDETKNRISESLKRRFSNQK